MHRLLVLLLLALSAITALADSVVVNCDGGQSLNSAISKLNKQIPKLDGHQRTSSGQLVRGIDVGE